MILIYCLIHCIGVKSQFAVEIKKKNKKHEGSVQ